MPTITCPACEYARDVDAARLAPAPLKLKCPSCRAAFVVDGAALLAALDAPGPGPELELDWGDRAPRSASAVLPSLAEQEAVHPTLSTAPLGANLDRFRGLGQAPDRATPTVTPNPPRRGEGVPPVVAASRPPESSPPDDFTNPPVVVADRFGIDDERINAWALPIAFCVAVFAKLLWLPGALLEYFRVWLHEFGHALVAWLGSRAATPLALLPGIGWASINPEKSAVVFVCFLFLLMVLGYRGWRAGAWYLVVIAAGLAVLQLWFSLFATPGGWEQAGIWAGVGGELVLSTVLIVGFYYRLPDRLRWDFGRFVALVIAMYVFVMAFWLWARAVGDPRLIPYGSGIFGSEDGNGDMNRLRAFGWSPKRIAKSYLVTGLLCAAAIAGHYVHFLRRGRAGVRRIRASGTGPPAG